MKNTEKQSIIGKEKPENLSDDYYGKFCRLLALLGNDNTIKYTNNNPILKKDICAFLKMKSERSFEIFIKALKNLNMINKIKKTIKNKNVYFLAVNPIYGRNINFEWSIEIFEMFEEEIKKNIKSEEYLLLNVKMKNLNLTETIHSFSLFPYGISGIYRLYKNKRIVYIGKSLCIKNRIIQHTKDKDFDNFDFVYMENESNKNIYEVYLIDKFKPLYNKDCVEKCESDLKLKELSFSKIIEIKFEN